MRERNRAQVLHSDRERRIPNGRSQRFRDIGAALITIIEANDRRRDRPSLSWRCYALSAAEALPGKQVLPIAIRGKSAKSGKFKTVEGFFDT